MNGKDKVFVVHAPIRDIAVFEKLAALVEKLKPHGRVEVNVSNLAEKSRFEVPEGGSPWHEYASYNPTPFKYFPPARLAPFFPAGHVKKNRDMLLAKREVLRRHGLGAAFWSYEPNFLPEAFFEAHPHLRGARSDHPRRSCKEAFAPCVDRDETQEMIAESVAALVKAVPELGTFFFKTNDAGPGLCWSYWLYSGPNGPDGCRRRNMGDRVRGMLDAINRGAEDAGGKLDIHMSGNFSETEHDDIARRLPENATLLRRSRKTMSVGSNIDRGYPVRGLFNPLALLRSLQRLGDGEVRTVFVDFRSSYDRGCEMLDTVAKVLDVVDDFLREPAFGTLPVLQRLRRWCDRWAGAERGERLFEALVAMDEAFGYKDAAFPGFRPIHVVSSRYMTRPLVAMPEKLTPDEETYFLPFVFNIHRAEARTDYIDVHGGRLAPTSMGDEGSDPRCYAVDSFRAKVAEVAKTLEDLKGAPEAEFFRGVAASLRIYASLMRSANNFYSVQVLRDRNREKLGGPEVIPPKVGTLTGDPDLLLMNEFMRDELDNASTLIDLLDGGGLDRVVRAAPSEEEDTFLLGGDLVDQVRRKMKVMRAHWLDAAKHLATPHK
jgi:hypothetical protein